MCCWPPRLNPVNSRFCDRFGGGDNGHIHMQSRGYSSVYLRCAHSADNPAVCLVTMGGPLRRGAQVFAGDACPTMGMHASPACSTHQSNTSIGTASSCSKSLGHARQKQKIFSMLRSHKHTAPSLTRALTRAVNQVTRARYPKRNTAYTPLFCFIKD
jgi:hypothetical protein